MDDIRDAACTRLMAVDPRQSVDVMLGLVQDYAEAAVAGLFLGHEQTVETVARNGVAHALTARVQSIWERERTDLCRGRPYVEPQARWCVWPIADEAAAAAIGLLYLEASPEGSLRLATVRATIDGLGHLLLGAVRQRNRLASAIDDYLEATPSRDVARRQLITLLDRHEWNLSRVARLAGVTRLTIYNRMRRLGIQRIRIRKATA